MLSLAVGVAYYAAAWIGVTQTITPEGMAVLWPANAVVLTAFLMLPLRAWPGIAVAVMTAEILADFSTFPLWAAIAFGAINLFEAALAALLIRRLVDEPFSFQRVRNGCVFLFCGPFLAASLTAVAGAAVYLGLGRTDTTFISLWRVWWFGDGLGLLLLTPLLVVTWRRVEAGRPRLEPKRLGEIALLWLVVTWVCMFAFKRGEPGELAYFIKPSWLIPLAIIPALRWGLAETSATVTLIAALMVGHLVNGIHPYGETAPWVAVWLTQEHLAAIVVVAVGLAIVMTEFDDQRQSLERNQQLLERSNLELEERVRARTLELEQVNETLAAVNRTLTVAATTDELTGLSNRRHLYAQASRELNRLRHDGATATVIMLDVDRFKEVNDAYGHEAGDRVLQALHDPIEHALRPGDLAGRIGGEEFLILLSNQPLEVGLKAAERIRSAIENTAVTYQGASIPLTASLGVAQWDGKSSLGTLIYRADEALYQAKAKGRNRVESSKPE